MNVVTGCAGERGDVEAAVALSLALRDRGHSVTLAADRDQTANLAPWKFTQVPLHHVTQPFGLRDETIHACAAADAIILPAALLPETLMLADLVERPIVIVVTTPAISPSAFIAQPFVAARPFKLRALNSLTYQIYDRRITSRAAYDDYVRARAGVGLATKRIRFVQECTRRRIPQLHTYSTVLRPRAPDWPAYVSTPGRIAISPARRFAAGTGGLPAELERWLDAGPPPIGLHFGSLPTTGTRRYLELARSVVCALGVRVVLRLPTLLEQAPPWTPELAVTSETNEDAWFARCRAVAHHGGSNVSAASAIAGIPAVACPVWGDQPMWGERIRALGIGEYLPFARLSARRLTAALRRLDRSETRERARDISARMSAEDGTAAGIALVEGLSASNIGDGTSQRR